MYTYTQWRPNNDKFMEWIISCTGATRKVSNDNKQTCAVDKLNVTGALCENVPQIVVFGWQIELGSKRYFTHRISNRYIFMVWDFAFAKWLIPSPPEQAHGWRPTTCLSFQVSITCARLRALTTGDYKAILQNQSQCTHAPMHHAHWRRPAQGLTFGSENA